MDTYTYTNAYTRTQAVEDQIRVLFTEAGIDKSSIDKICIGVRNRWFQSVGLYLKRSDRRVYEIEARIGWSAHSDFPRLEFSTDLPGWAGNASPEVLVLGKRFAGVAAEEQLQPHYWGLFTPEIIADPPRHERICPEVGLSYGSHVADWGITPRTTSLPLQDLREMGLSERSAL